MKILYEDKHTVVAIKPTNVLSQFSENEENMVTLLSEHTSGEVFVISRLDRNVGGVTVYAKTKFAAAQLTRQMQEGTFTKTYIAAVHEKPEQNSGTLEDLLFKDSRKNKTFVVKRERKGVKKAKLRYKVLSEKDGISLIEIHLQTGRTHQIRVQFSSRKMPLVGDGKYGSRDNSPNMGLFVKEIAFKKINSEEVLCFSAEPDKVYPWNLFIE